MFSKPYEGHQEQIFKAAAVLCVIFYFWCCFCIVSCHTTPASCFLKIQDAVLFVADALRNFLSVIYLTRIFSAECIHQKDQLLHAKVTMFDLLVNDRKTYVISLWNNLLRLAFKSRCPHLDIEKSQNVWYSTLNEEKSFSWFYRALGPTKFPKRFNLESLAMPWRPAIDKAGLVFGIGLEKHNPIDL